MKTDRRTGIKKEELRTPCYLIQKEALIRNLEQLNEIREKTGCRILLAQKAFSMYALYPLIGQYLDGAAASGLYEARLGREEMGRENHVYLSRLSGRRRSRRSWHTAATSCLTPRPSWKKYRERAVQAGKKHWAPGQSGALHPGGPCHLRPLRARIPARAPQAEQFRPGTDR